MAEAVRLRYMIYTTVLVLEGNAILSELNPNPARRAAIPDIEL